MLKKLLVFTLLTTAAFSVFSQQESEDKLIERADELFAEQKYAEAFPVYSQLVSLHPQSPIFNFKFGACAVFTGDGQTTSTKHLNFAINKGVKNPLAHYFLGRAFHLNYQFEDAIKSYEKFRQKADKKDLEEFEVESLIEQCEFGKNLLSGIKEVVVLEKTEASIDDYFRYYNLDKIGGRMLATPEELLSKIDKKKNYRSTIHYSGSETSVYFPSYGKDEETGTDIYRAYLLPDGNWSEPEKIEGFVNTQQNEDFAFFHPDGKTLYFASEGHNSMGGFDIFKSIYNAADDNFGPPENMDFAVNTPGNDIFYVADKNKETAYFSSDRTSSQNKLHVYKVKVKTIPLNVVAIDGDFVSEIAPSEKKITIRVLASEDKSLINTLQSDEITGEYKLAFERAGNYILEVESPGSPYIHEAEMRIPEFDRPVLLSQKMRLVKENGTEKLIVDNLFDNPRDLDLNDISLDVIRQKAGLDVNADDDRIAQAENQTDQNADPAVIAGFADGTTAQDVILQMDKRSAELAEKAADEQAQSLNLVGLAESKKQKSDSLLREISAVRSKLDKENKEQYLKDLAQLKEMMSEVKKLNVETAAAIELSKQSEAYSEKLKGKSFEISQRAEATKSAQSAGNEKELLSLLKEEHDSQRIQKESETTPELLAAREKSEKEKESRELYEEVEELKSDARSVMRDLQVMRERESATSNKDKKDKEEIQLRVSQLETEVEMLQSDINRKRKQANEAIDEANLAGAKVSLISNSEDWQSEPITASSPETVDAERNQITTELATIEQRTRELDFNDEESMVLASDEMKFTRNDIKADELVADYRDAAPIELKKSSELRREFRSVSEKLTSGNANAETLRTSNELQSSIAQHIDFWEEKKSNSSAEEKSNIGNELSDLKLIQTELMLLSESAENDLAENSTDKEPSRSETDSTGSGSNRDASTPERESEADLNTGQNKAEDLTSEANSQDGSETTTESEESVDAGDASQSSQEAIPSVDRVENEAVKSLAMQLPEAESLADYDAQSQQLIQLDNKLRDQIEDEDNTAKRDSLVEARKDVKRVQFDLKTLDDLYIAELNEIQDQNTSDQLKSRQEIELNRKFAQLIDKKKFQLESYKSRNEELPFSSQKINQELENRKYKAMTRMNGLRTALETGEEPEPNRLAENRPTERDEVLTEKTDRESQQTEQSAEISGVKQPTKTEEAGQEEFANTPAEISLNISLDEPTEEDMDAAYETDSFKEMYARQAGVNLRFRNEDDIEKHRAEIQELQTQVDSGDESSRTIRKLDNAILDLAEEEARNGTKVRRMVEQSLEEYEDVIATQQRISEESLSEEEERYVELLEATVDQSMMKADSLRGLAMNESNPVDQNILFKKAYVYESRAVESKKAIADMYDSREWNEDLVAISGSGEKSSESARTEEASENRPQELSENEASTESGFNELEETSDRLVETTPTPDPRVNEDESSLRLDTAEESSEAPSTTIGTFTTEDENKARSMVSATVNQRESFEEELTEEQLQQLEQVEGFAEYNEQVNEIREQQKELSITLTQLQEKRRAYAEVNQQIESLEEELNDTADEERKTEIKEELTRLRVQAEVKYKEVREERQKTQQQATMLDAAIVEANADYRELISGVKSRKAGQLANATAAELARFEMPRKLEQNVFATAEKSVYSEENPIPEVTEMPDGIVYQVQVGAFRNPIPQDHFREFAPVMAHNLNNGITRYTVGLFNQLSVAQGTRDQVRGMGYSDAFVVAYRNGERISIDEARAGEGKPAESIVEASGTENRNISPIANSAEETAVNAAPATPVEEVSGVFFTVQVGVFSKPINQGDLTVSPLNVDRTASGMIRYTSGVFSDYARADQRKEEIRRNGVPDAFVTAYFNGQRMSVERARQLMSEGANTPEPEIKQQQFIVFIGRYENQVPSDVARAMLMLEGRYGVVQESKEEYTDYFTKPVNSRLEAERIQAAFREFDVENTEIRPVSE